MRSKLTWLHISDAHFFPGTGARDDVVRKALLRDLKVVLESGHVAYPDFVFCTGDIGNGEFDDYSLVDQLREAERFFDRLLEVCGPKGSPLARHRLFVVPGNHDVNRDSIDWDAQDRLWEFAAKSWDEVDSVNQQFHDRSDEFAVAIPRLKEYGQFVERYLPHQHDSESRHIYAPEWRPPDWLLRSLAEATTASLRLW